MRNRWKSFRWIENNNLALPELQRPKVWADSKNSPFTFFHIQQLSIWHFLDLDPER